MASPKSNDPLHGITLEKLLTELVAQFGWPELARRIDIRCFRYDPSIKSSLAFLRKTPWARTKVEQLYVQTRPKPTASPGATEPSPALEQRSFASPPCSMPEIDD
jgi:uncharacterized protein (DUF2132 family)